MKKIKCFTREEAISHPGKYIIRPVHDNFHLDYTEGSFNVICARLMGLSYADYLRMCRECFGAEIIGKGSMFPIAIFKFSKDLNDLIDNLNARANMVLWEREHPDYKGHQEFVREKEPKFYKGLEG